MFVNSIALKSNFKDQKIYSTFISVKDLKSVKNNEKKHDFFDNVIYADTADSCLWTPVDLEFSVIERYEITGKLTTNLELCSKNLNFDLSGLNDTDLLPVIFIKNFE